MHRAVSFALIIGIIVLINLLSKQFFFRWDVTEDKQYTLSSATKDILRNLDDPVSVKAYFSDNLPADFEKIKNDFRDMLIEYATISKGNVEYQFINPNESDQISQEAMQSGIRPLLINVREKDQATQQRAFMGAVMTLGDQEEIIPYIGPETPMEYTLTTGIKKIAVVDKPSIGFIQGHGEPPLSNLAQAVQALSVLYSVENIDLAAEESIPDRYQVVAWVAPTDSIPQAHFNKVTDYLDRGGNMVIGVNRVEGDFSTAQGRVTETNVGDWLQSLGIVIDPNFVIDASCGNVTVQQRQGFFTINTPIQFPYLPIVKNFGDHPIVKGLDQVIFQFVSPVRFSGDTTSSFTPLVSTSDKSGIQNAPVFFDVGNKKWTDADFPMQNVTIAGILQRNPAGELPSKIVVVGDGDFSVGGGQQGGGVNPDNVSLLVNSVEWLSDESGLSELRTKGVLTRPIDELEDSKRSFLKYFNFFLPIVLVLAYGVFHAQRNRSRRIRRMQERYV